MADKQPTKEKEVTFNWTIPDWVSRHFVDDDLIKLVDDIMPTKSIKLTETDKQNFFKMAESRFRNRAAYFNDCMNGKIKYNLSKYCNSFEMYPGGSSPYYALELKRKRDQLKSRDTYPVSECIQFHLDGTIDFEYLENPLVTTNEITKTPWAEWLKQIMLKGVYFHIERAGSILHKLDMENLAQAALSSDNESGSKKALEWLVQQEKS